MIELESCATKSNGSIYYKPVLKDSMHKTALKFSQMKNCLCINAWRLIERYIKYMGVCLMTFHLT